MTEQIEGRYWPKNLGEVLRDEGRRQDWLAAQAQVHPSFISHLVAGRKSAPREVAQRIADALGVDLFLIFESTQQDVLSTTKEAAVA